MSERVNRGGFFSAAGMFCLYATILLAALYVVGTNAALYYRLQTRAEVLSWAGVSAEELRKIDGALAKYLSGGVTALEACPFNAVERAHLEDCFELFALLRKVLPICAALAAVCLILGRGRGLFRGAGISAAVFLAPFVAAVLWGIVDFDSLFTLFHELLFRNDLWLLNPETDLLIRICPQSMFAAMAAMIGGASMALTGVCVFLAALGGKRHG